jgi:hypothetical protein
MQSQLTLDASERLREALMRLLSFVLVVARLFELSLFINGLNLALGKPTSTAECCWGRAHPGQSYSVSSSY